MTFDGKHLTTIGKGAFNNESASAGSCPIFDDAQTVELPEGLTSIGDLAFLASAFGGLVFPNSLTSLPNAGTYDKSCFGYMENLTTVTFGDGLTSVPDFAFYSCFRLQTVTFGEKISSIGKSAFNGCCNYTGMDTEKLTKKALDSNVSKNYNIAAEAQFTNPAGLKTATNGHVDSTFVLPEGITTIGESAFQKAYISKLTFPTSLTAIGTKAFWMNPISEINWANTCEGLAIGESAFQSVTNSKYIYGYEFAMEELVLPDYITSIGKNAFKNCASLKKVTINGNPVLGDAIFEACGIYTNSSTGETLWYGNPLTDIYINGAVTKATYNAKPFANINSSNPSDTATIFIVGTSVFREDNVLYEVIIDTSGALPVVQYRALLTLDPTAETLTLKAGTVAIADYAFGGMTNLTSVTLPDGLLTIGKEAFRGDTNVASVSLPNSLTTIGSGAFYSCSSLTTLHLENTSVTAIQSETFKSCGKLESIVLPSNLTEIGTSAFESCSKLLYVNLQDTQVATLSTSAFKSCSALTNVILPATCTTIQANAFGSCSALSVVVLPSTSSIITLENKTGLNSTNFKGTIYAPTEALQTSYKAATNWNGLTKATWETVSAPANVTLSDATTTLTVQTTEGVTTISLTISDAAKALTAYGVSAAYYYDADGNVCVVTLNDGYATLTSYVDGEVVTTYLVTAEVNAVKAQATTDAAKKLEEAQATIDALKNLTEERKAAIKEALPTLDLSAAYTEALITTAVTDYNKAIDDAVTAAEDEDLKAPTVASAAQYASEKKEAISSLTLDAVELDAYLAQIDAIELDLSSCTDEETLTTALNTYKGKVDEVVTAATDRADAVSETVTAANNYATEKKTAIDGLTNLSEMESAIYKSEIDEIVFSLVDLTEADALSAALNAYKTAVNAVVATATTDNANAPTVTEAVEYANEQKAAIDDLELDDPENASYKLQIDTVVLDLSACKDDEARAAALKTYKDSIDTIVNAAKERAGVVSETVTSASSYASQQKKTVIDNLSSLTSDEKEAYDAQIDAIVLNLTDVTGDDLTTALDAYKAAVDAVVADATAANTAAEAEAAHAAKVAQNKSDADDYAAQQKAAIASLFSDNADAAQAYSAWVDAIVLNNSYCKTTEEFDSVLAAYKAAVDAVVSAAQAAATPNA
jgi:hypothetical protein